MDKIMYNENLEKEKILLHKFLPKGVDLIAC